MKKFLRTHPEPLVGLETVNKPVVSKHVAALYASLIALIFTAGILTTVMAYRSGQPMAAAVALPAVVVAAFLLIQVLRSLYGTRYVVSDGKLIIHVSRFVGGSKTVDLSAVRSVKRTLIPFGLRLFGASFHGGYYHVPGLGRTFMAITNFSDGVLIETKDGNYIITPRNPDEFVSVLKSRTASATAHAE